MRYRDGSTSATVLQGTSMKFIARKAAQADDIEGSILASAASLIMTVMAKS